MNGERQIKIMSKTALFLHCYFAWKQKNFLFPSGMKWNPTHALLNFQRSNSFDGSKAREEIQVELE